MKSIEEIRKSEKRTVGDYLEVVDGAFHCAKCDQHLGSSTGNYKENLAMRKVQIEDLGPHWINPDTMTDEDMVFREFFCPNCATRLATEIAKEEAPILPNYNLYE